MKVINFAVVAAAMLVCPVLLCSCTSDDAQTKKKQEIQTPKQEAEPSAIEVTSETTIPEPEAPAKAEPAEAPAPAKAEPAKAPAPAKAEPAEAPAPAKAEPAKAPAPAKAEPAKAPAPAKAEPAKAPAPAKVELPCEHTVRTGDNLWNISRRYYGSGTNWKKIYEANKSEIKKPEFLEPGTVLKIPVK